MMAHITTLVLTIVLLTFLLTGAGSAPTQLQGLSKVDNAPNPNSLSTGYLHTLSKRHNWVLICYLPGPNGKASTNEDIKTSKRCTSQPYNYFCDGSKCT